MFQVPPQDTADVVKHALRTGYRSVDTAAAYKNEEGVGEAIADSGLDRDDVFITTKLANDNHGHDTALRALDESLRKLGMDYVDLYLIHWPRPSAGKFVETWQAFIEAKQAGRARSIGVSNFRVQDIEAIVDATGVAPAVNQIELHPRFQQSELRREHAKHGILTEAWSPLGQGELIDDETISKIASGQRSHPGTGDPALAHPARQRRDPQVGYARADRRELPGVRLRVVRRRHACDRATRLRGRAHRTRPVDVRINPAGFVRA